jgi:hypothetical protein
MKTFRTVKSVCKFRWLLLFQLFAFPLSVKSSSEMALETIHRFISDTPPAVKEMIYFAKGKMYPNAPDYVARLIHARWSTNTFYLCQIPSLEAVTNPPTLDAFAAFAAYSGSDYWSLNTGLGYIYSSPTISTNFADRFSVWVNENYFLSALRMGVRGVTRTNSINWISPTNFLTATEMGAPVSGSVVLDSNGYPTGLSMLYNNRAVKIVQFAYLTNVGEPYFPNEINVFGPSGEHEAQYYVYKLQTDKHPLDPALTSVASILKNSPKPVFLSSNGTVIRIGMSDQPLYSEWNVVPFVGPRTDRNTRWLWVVAATIFAGPIIITASLWVKRKKFANHNRN